MIKKLRLFNGRAEMLRKFSGLFWENLSQSETYGVTAYIAAYSISDLMRVISEYTQRSTSRSEIDNYWSKDAWGNSMAGVQPERGIWLKKRKFK
jgi:hypothetical protein